MDHTYLDPFAPAYLGFKRPTLFSFAQAVIFQQENLKSTKGLLSKICGAVLPFYRMSFTF